MSDLTEKLKELLMRCDCGTSNCFTLFDANDECYTLGKSLAGRIAKQLAPEIEKMMPRWIPVSERLPDEIDMVDLWANGTRYENMFFTKGDTGNYFISPDVETMICLYGNNDDIYWMPIMKGPTG